MTTPIHPDALKAYRKQRHLTQEKLAEATKGKNKVSLPTIKRIESTRDGTRKVTDRVAEGLAKALGVTIDDLSEPPKDGAESEELLRRRGYRRLHTMLDRETALAFEMVQHIFGIPVRSQIVMAPLFATLLAEASLAWRRERVAQIEDATDRLQGLGGGGFSFAYLFGRVELGAEHESFAIKNRDLFGENEVSCEYPTDDDSAWNNPFAEFLDHFAKEVEAKTVSLDPDYGWKTSEGMPYYQIGEDLISELTGDDADAVHALEAGHVRPADIPADLRGDEKRADRISWIIDQVPEAALAEARAFKEAIRESTLEGIVFPGISPGAAETRNEAREGDDA